MEERGGLKGVRVDGWGKGGGVAATKETLHLHALTRRKQVWGVKFARDQTCNSCNSTVICTARGLYLQGGCGQVVRDKNGGKEAGCRCAGGGGEGGGSAYVYSVERMS